MSSSHDPSVLASVEQGWRTRDEALTALFESEYRSLVRLAWGFCQDQNLAEDVTQEAFARLYNRWSRIRAPEAAPAYLRRTVLNELHSRFRRRALTFRVATDDDQGYQGAETREAELVDLRRALRTLPRRKLECVVLRYYMDLSEIETAQVLGVAVGTVKSQTSRALQALAVILKMEDAL